MSIPIFKLATIIEVDIDDWIEVGEYESEYADKSASNHSSCRWELSPRRRREISNSSIHIISLSRFQPANRAIERGLSVSLESQIR